MLVGREEVSANLKGEELEQLLPVSRITQKWFTVFLMNKFCVYCQEVTPHYMNEYGALECCNCEPLSESEYESETDSSQDDPTYVTDND